MKDKEFAKRQQRIIDEMIERENKNRLARKEALIHLTSDQLIDKIIKLEDRLEDLELSFESFE